MSKGETTTDWKLLLGLMCPVADVELLPRAVLTSVGQKTSTGESTVWGIQSLRNGHFWIKFRDAKARNMLLREGGFMCQNHFISVFPLENSVQWFLLSGIPLTVEKPNIVSVLQRYGTVYEAKYETVQGFDDVYTGDLRVLLDLTEQLPEVLEICEYNGSVVCLGPVNQICRDVKSVAPNLHDCQKNNCKERLLEISKFNIEPKDSLAKSALPEKRCNDELTDVDDVVTDAVPLAPTYSKKASTLQDELKKLRYNNMGAAIAWGYFIYLRDTAFEKLKKRIRVYEDVNTVELDIQKLLIVVPMSCSYKTTEDMKIKYARHLEVVKEDVAGTADRTYHLSVYKMREGKENIYFISDTASCLNALDTMRKEFHRTGLTQALQRLIRDQFVEVLEYLLYQDRGKCRGKYELLYIEGDGANLAKEVRLLKEKQDVKTTEFPNVPKYDFDNFGVGLANWYYFNYLKLILGDFTERMEDWKSANKGCTLYPKLIILVPKSCVVKSTFDEDEDDVIKKAAPLEDHVEACGTTVGRTFSQTIYRIDMKHCAPQYATPIRQLHKMTEVSNHYVEDRDMFKARDDFCSELKELLLADEKDICEVIYFDDDQPVSAVLRRLLIAESSKQKSTKKE